MGFSNRRWRSWHLRSRLPHPRRDASWPLGGHAPRGAPAWAGAPLSGSSWALISAKKGFPEPPGVRLWLCRTGCSWEAESRRRRVAAVPESAGNRAGSVLLDAESRGPVKHYPEARCRWARPQAVPSLLFAASTQSPLCLAGFLRRGEAGIRLVPPSAGCKERNYSYSPT